MHLKEIIKDGQVKFNRYADGNLIYTVYDPIAMRHYEYDVPIEETKGGVFERNVKAIYHMRWIRKSIQNKRMRLTGV
ncbi:MAG: hypothetical protein PVG65_03455 [Candidatus Thorarchaeota archaeon]|jgi:hypothetical protein